MTYFNRIIMLSLGRILRLTKKSLSVLLVFSFAFNIQGQIDTSVINYTYNGSFVNSSGNSPFTYNFIEGITIVEDLSNTWDEDYVLAQWVNLTPKKSQSIKPRSEVTYWLRIKVNGNELIRKHFFQIGSEQDNDVVAFSHIDAFFKIGEAEWRHQNLGVHVPVSQRPVKFWANFIQVDLLPNQKADLLVKLKMTEKDKKFLPPKIGIVHIDESSVWPSQMYIGQWHAIFYAIMLFHALYMLFLFVVERNELHLFLALIILGSLIGIAFTLDNFRIYAIFPSWRSIHDALSFLGIFLVVYGVMKFTLAYFNYPKNSFIAKKLVPIVTIGSFLSITLSFIMRDIQKMNPLPLTLLMISGGISLYVANNSKEIAHKFRQYYLLAFLPPLLVLTVMFAYSLNLDWLKIDNFSVFFDYLKSAFLITLFSLALSSGYRTKKLKEEKEAELRNNLEKQQKINKAISKFVPNEFINALGKKAITDVSLGDHTEREVSVLFTDIRGYTSMSEKLSPGENFKFVGDYSAQMGPIIRKNNGFINQYLGDGIMALFPGNPSDALHAAIEMMDTLESFNEQRTSKNLLPIQVGMGMHTGPLIMGILGDEYRYDAATISDTVNTAARLEGLTKEYDASIILSSECLEKMTSAPSNISHLGTVKVKGKAKSIDIYNVQLVKN